MTEPETTEERFVTIPLKTLDAFRREIGRHINPETAELWWEYGHGVDPYGDIPDLPDSSVCIGRVYFAKAPDSEFWISFGDLPKDVVAAIWKRLEQKKRSDESASANMVSYLVGTTEVDGSGFEGAQVAMPIRGENREA